MDVKSAFLNGHLTEDIHIHQPEGYEKAGEEHKVYKLKKALYGLKQAPRVWYSRLDSHLIEIGFTKSLNEATLYVKNSGKDLLIVSIYVDDILITGSREVEVEEFKAKMRSAFEMSDLGKMAYFLGMEVQQWEQGIFIHQMNYY